MAGRARSDLLPVPYFHVVSRCRADANIAYQNKAVIYDCCSRHRPRP